MFTTFDAMDQLQGRLKRHHDRKRHPRLKNFHTTVNETFIATRN